MVEILPADLPTLLSLGIVGGTLGVLFGSRTLPRSYVLGFSFLFLFGVEFFFPRVGENLALIPERVESGRAWWSLLSYSFVHAGFAHLFGNLLILVTAGAALEEKMGPRPFLWVYFTAGIAAGLSHIAMSHILPSVVSPSTAAVGASGAIFGVLTAWSVHYPRKELPIFLGFFLLWLPSFVVLLIYLGLNIAYMFSETNVAWWGHFSGFLVGLLFWGRLGGPSLRPKEGVNLDWRKLEPLLTSPRAKEILLRIESASGQTEHDDLWRKEWIERLLSLLSCPQGHTVRIEGTLLKCSAGEFLLDLSFDPKGGEETSSRAPPS